MFRGMAAELALAAVVATVEVVVAVAVVEMGVGVCLERIGKVFLVAVVSVVKQQQE